MSRKILLQNKEWLEKALKNGASAEKIASMLGATEDSVRFWIKKHNIKRGFWAKIKETLSKIKL